MNTLSRTRMVAALALVALLAFPSAAAAWSNGPARGNGFGTHDWALVEANRLAAAQGATWVNAGVALPVTDDPDTVIRDYSYHIYDRWGRPAGNAHVRVAVYYAQAVAYLKAGDIDNASRMLALLSHYYVDVNNPLNTDEVSAEKRMHQRYDDAVDKKLYRVGRFREWIRYDGYQHVSSASGLTVASATAAHRSYSKLVNQYRRRGYDTVVRNITASSMNRAVNGLADIIVSIQQDAAEGWASPSVAAHQGVATDQANYYIFHTTWIQKYDASWVSLETTSDPMAGLDGFTGEQHLGAGCYYDGKLYVPAENWPSATNQHILVFDANTLERIAAVPTGRTDEVAAMTVVPDEGENGVLYVASFLDSTRLFKYDLASLAFLGTLGLSPPPTQGIQGLAYHNGRFYLAEGRARNLGRVYFAERTGGTRLIFSSGLLGWHEGVDFLKDDLIWLVDNGPADSRVRSFRLPPH